VIVARICIKVDFPAPLGPSNVNIPGSSVRLKSRNPQIFPLYRLLRLSILSFKEFFRKIFIGTNIGGFLWIHLAISGAVPIHWLLMLILSNCHHHLPAAARSLACWVAAIIVSFE
jgi:hypothetical protein